MNNKEWINKAYMYYGGCWLDENMNTVMYSSFHGFYLAKSMDGLSPYKDSLGAEFLLSVWSPVCTKAEFDAYGKSLKEAPVETEAVLGANIWKADEYKVQVKFSEEDSTEDEIWIPRVGQECEVFYLDEWLTCVLTNENILIQNEDGDWFPEDREYLLENCEFRQAPVENFIEKFLDLCVEHFVEIEGGQEIRGNFSSEESFRKAAKYFYKRGMCFKEDS